METSTTTGSLIQIMIDNFWLYYKTIQEPSSSKSSKTSKTMGHCHQYLSSQILLLVRKKLKQGIPKGRNQEPIGRVKKDTVLIYIYESSILEVPSHC